MTSPDPDRDAIGVHASTYATYRGLAVATGDLEPKHQPDYQDTQPTVTVGHTRNGAIRPKIVTFDPWGHRTAQDFRKDIAAGRRLRPSIAITTGRLKIAGWVQAMEHGSLTPDGTVLSLDNSDIVVTKLRLSRFGICPALLNGLRLMKC